MQQKREAKKDDELKEVRSGPTISKNSARIVKNMNRAHRIEDQLLTQGNINQQRRKERKAREDKKAREEAARPRISIHSARFPDRGDVSERLYKQARDKQERESRQRRRMVHDEEMVRGSTDRP